MLSAKKALARSRKKGPEFVGFTSSNNGNSVGTGLTISKPSGVIEGDLLVAILSSSGAGQTWTGDTGWTEVSDPGAGNVNPRLAWKVATSSEAASYTFALSSQRSPIGQILAFRNAAFDVIGASYSSGSGGSITAGSITAAGGILVTWFSSSGGSLSSLTGPSGASLTELTYNNATGKSSCAAWVEPIPAGATGTRSISFSGPPYAFGILFGIKSA